MGSVRTTIPTSSTQTIITCAGKRVGEEEGAEWER